MRLPNGYGSVHKLPGNRRKPYRVRVTMSWNHTKDNKKKQHYKTIGYYATKEEGLMALAIFNKSPFNICYNNITFDEVFSLWSEEHFKKIVPSAMRVWKAAFNHSELLMKMRFRDIKTIHLEIAINNANVGNATKLRMKSLYNMMFKYAIKHEIVNKNYAEFCETPKVDKTYERIPFSCDEIKTLWENIDIPYVNMILVGIYSGWRPRELAELENKNIDLKEKTMIGGLKTQAGKNRIVPIHNSIYSLISNRYDKNNERLFLKENGKRMNYDDYRNRFRKVMKALNMNHKPHDVRHTFVTLAKKYDMNEYAIKLIIGHAIQDVTEKVYTHRTIEELKNEINKIQCVL